MTKQYKLDGSITAEIIMALARTVGAGGFIYMTPWQIARKVMDLRNDDKWRICTSITVRRHLKLLVERHCVESRELPNRQRVLVLHYRWSQSYHTALLAKVALQLDDANQAFDNALTMTKSHTSSV